MLTDECRRKFLRRRSEARTRQHSWRNELTSCEKYWWKKRSKVTGEAEQETEVLLMAVLTGSGIADKQCDEGGWQTECILSMQNVWWQSWDSQSYCSRVHCPRPESVHCTIVHKSWWHYKVVQLGNSLGSKCGFERELNWHMIIL